MIVQAMPYPATGGGGGAHRYWRLYITANDGDATNISVLELGMRESKHGPNLCTGGTAAASTTGSGSPASAFSSDFDDSKTWSSSNGSVTNQWLSYDFGSAKSIKCIDLWAPSGTTYATTEAPKDFQIQYSDDNASWTTAWSESGQTAWRTREHRKFVDPSYTETVFAMGSHVTWHLLITENHGAASNVGIAEIQFRSAAGVSQSSSGGTAAASSTLSSSYVAGNAFNGDGGTTFWTSSQGPASFNAQEIEYVHPSARSVVELMLQARNDAFRSEHPKYFQLFWSDGSLPLTHGYDGATLSAWGLNEIRLFNVTPT